MAEKSNIFLRYVRLINLVSRRGHISFEEIQDEWLRMFGIDLPRRTFIRHREAIADIFGLEIMCRKSDNTYYIQTEGLNRDDDDVIHLANILSANRLISNSKQLAARVIHEYTPSGDRYLEPIIEAMKSGWVIYIGYHKFGTDRTESIRVEPYCVKCYQRRWYLLGRRCDDGQLREYALDRISDMDLSHVRFSLPEDFNSAEIYSDVIGVTYFDIPEKQRIVIHADDEQRDYLRTLPLHSTQKEIEPGLFELNIRPSYDFIQELRRHSDKIEVLEPQWLRERIKDDAERVMEKYNQG